MGPRDFAFYAAVFLVPAAFSAGAAAFIGRQLGGRRPSTAMWAVGFLLGLLLTPIAIVTVGTLGGGYWEGYGLPGGPLVGVVVALSAACTATTAFLVSLGLAVRKAASWVTRRCPLLPQGR